MPNFVAHEAKTIAIKNIPKTNFIKAGKDNLFGQISYNGFCIENYVVNKMRNIMLYMRNKPFKTKHVRTLHHLILSMKKHFYFIFLFGLITAQSFSQGATDAQNILDKLSAKVKSAKGISASFTLTQYDKSHQLTGSSKGIVKIKDNKYYVKQDETEIYCNGTQTWNFDGSNEVTVSKNDGSTDDVSPQQILTGFNKNDFTYKLISSAGNNYEILLLPVDKRKNFKQVTIFINKSTNVVSKAKITDKSDNIIELNFSAINLNAVIADSQFTFDASKHKGVEVINE